MEETTTTIVSETLSNTDVEKYASMIDRYGIGVVVAAAFIMIALAALFVLMRSYLKVQKQVQDQQNEMFKTILETLKQSTSNKTQDQSQPNNTHKDLIDTFTKINTPIRQVLEDVANNTGADRTSVYVFHNGINSTHGLPFVKVTCLTEVMRKGTLITRKTNIHNGLSVSMFDKSVPFLSKNEYVTVPSLDSIAEDYPVVNSMLETAGAKSAVFLGMYDADQNMLGFMITEFEEEKTSDELDITLVDMRDGAKSITPILDYSDYQKNNT